MSNALDLVREMRDAIDAIVRADDAQELTGDEIDAGRALIAKADSYLKESAETVKYGCAKPWCVVMQGSSICPTCKYWTPIKGEQS